MRRVDTAGPRDRVRSSPDGAGVFAADLRELRHSAGNPTLHALAQSTLISKSVLSEAFAGHRLPTENTVRRLVEALGADASPWLERRAAVAGGGGMPVATGRASVVTASGDRALPSRSAVLAGIAALVAVILASITWWIVGGGGQADARAGASLAVPRTLSQRLPPVPDADPTRTLCADDATVAASEPRLDGAVRVTILYSAQCDAVWAQLTRLHDRLEDRDLTLTIFPFGDPYGGRGRSVTATETSTMHTKMVLNSSQTQGVCAVVSFAPRAGGTPVVDEPLCP